MDKFSEKVKLVNDALIKVINKFLKNPANYFYEEEIRSELYTVLRDSFEEKFRVKLKYDSWFKDYCDSPKELINPVRAEYGRDKEYAIKNNMANIDIGILADNTEDKSENNFQRACDIVIEIKYSQDSFNAKQAGFIEDYKKVKKIHLTETNNKIYLGIAICFDLKCYKNIAEKKNFIKKYQEDENNIVLRELSLNDKNKLIELNIRPNECYAIYITPESVFINP